MATTATALQMLDLTLDRLASARLALADARYALALKHIRPARRVLDRLDTLCTAAAVDRRQDRAAHVVHRTPENHPAP